jgi:hypothetical protein
VVNEVSPGALRESIERAYAEMMEKSASGRGRFAGCYGGAVGVGRRQTWLRSGCGALTCDYFHEIKLFEPSAISMK